MRDDDEQAKRFDLLVLRIQLAMLDGDHVLAERLRQQLKKIVSALLSQTAIPSVAARQQLLDEVAGDEWWVDVTLPMLELVRRRIRVWCASSKSKRAIVFTDFEDDRDLAAGRRKPKLQDSPHRTDPRPATTFNVVEPDIHHDDPAFGYRFIADELAEQGLAAGACPRALKAERWVVFASSLVPSMSAAADDDLRVVSGQRVRRICSTRSRASPKSIRVFSRKNSGFWTPA